MNYCAIKTANHGRTIHHVRNETELSTAAISYLGERCILLEPVLYTLVEGRGQMVLDIGMSGVERWVAVWCRLGARSLQGSVRGDYSFPFGLVRLLLLQRDSTQAINCGLGAEIDQENSGDEPAVDIRTLSMHYQSASSRGSRWAVYQFQSKKRK